MSKLCQILLFATATGMAQFGILVASGVDKPLALAAGVIGAMGGGILSHMHRLPQKKWSPQKREAQRDVEKAARVVEEIRQEEKDA